MGFLSRTPEDDGEAKKALSYHAPRPIVASAARINVSKKSELDTLKKRREAAKWQQDAWDYYDLIGEIKYAANLVASVTSRVRLYAGWITDNDTAPSNIQDISSDVVSDEMKARAAEALALLETGNGGIAGLLRDAALNLFVAGECYLVKEPAPDDSIHQDVWQIRSIDEVIVSKQGRVESVVVRETKTAKPAEYKKLPPNPFIGRIWRTHPRFSSDADSSLLGILDLCDQMLLYSRATRAAAKSRLNTGMLFMPDGFSIGDPDGEVDALEVPTDVMAPDSDNVAEQFDERLSEALSEPLENEASSRTLTPLIVTGPAELGEKIRHITFERPFDAQIAKDADRTLERILSALDLPKDVVSGMASVKYSNAITIEESLYKAHIEPLVLMIVDALSVVYFRTVLRNLGFPEELVRRACIWYDPSAITTKPDKATAATTGYEMKAISAQAWRRANGFSDTDAPDGMELLQRLASEKGLLSEPVVEAALRSLAPELFDQIRRQQAAMSEPGALDAVQDAVDGVQSEPATDDSDEDTPEPPVNLIEP